MLVSETHDHHGIGIDVYRFYRNADLETPDLSFTDIFRLNQIMNMGEENVRFGPGQGGGEVYTSTRGGRILVGVYLQEDKMMTMQGVSVRGPTLREAFDEVQKAIEIRVEAKRI